MPGNNFFQFKKFRINQEKSAMKVGVDGVLLGAWSEAENASRILDIGTGTGLVALMIAQKNEYAIIDAIEIDNTAFCEAHINIDNSPWRERINLIEMSFQEFIVGCITKYDLIVCNPPFFAGGIISESYSRNKARKSEFLPLNVLIAGSAEILNKGGKLCLILPSDCLPVLEKLVICNKLFISRICFLKPNPAKPVFRIMIEISNRSCERISEELMIEFDKHHDYTPEYKELTKDFYLKF